MAGVKNVERRESIAGLAKIRRRFAAGGPLGRRSGRRQDRFLIAINGLYEENKTSRRGRSRLFFAAVSLVDFHKSRARAASVGHAGCILQVTTEFSESAFPRRRQPP